MTCSETSCGLPTAEEEEQDEADEGEAESTVCSDEV